METPRLPSVRSLVASACALAAAVVMRSWEDSDLPYALWLPVILLGASALLLHRRHLGSQVLARAAWWANLVLGTLVAVASTASERPRGALLALASGAALLAAGPAGLAGDVADGGFAPRAFRTTLLAGMVLALADAQALILYGTIQLEDRRPGWLLVLCGVAELASLYGLYRLRTWGLLLGLLLNAAVVALALAGAFDLPRALAASLALTAGVQVLLPLPILRAIARGAAPEGEAVSRRGIALATTVVAALVTLACSAGLVLQRRLFDFN